MKYLHTLKIITLISLFFGIAILPALAQSTTPSSTPSPSPAITDEIKDNIKKRLEDSIKGIQGEIEASQTQSYIAQAFVGTVSEIIQNTITISTKDGKRYTTSLDSTALIRSPGNSPIKLENVRIDDYIIAMGKLKNETMLEGKRLVVSTTHPGTYTKATGMGTVTKVNAGSLQFNSMDNQSQTLFLDSSTVYKTASGIIEKKDIGVGDKLVYIATVEDDSLDASVILKMSGNMPNNLLPTTSPTPSASKKPSPTP